MSTFSPRLMRLAKDVIDTAHRLKMRIAGAESCTGGLVLGCLTEIPGSSAVVDRGFITYSNDSKIAQLSVRRKTLSSFGAVSAETVREMAEGALRASNADLAFAITGIAGPGGGTPEKPVGLVYIALADREKTVVRRHIFKGNRSTVRLATVKAALDSLMSKIKAPLSVSPRKRGSRRSR